MGWAKRESHGKRFARSSQLSSLEHDKSIKKSWSRSDQFSASRSFERATTFRSVNGSEWVDCKIVIQYIQPEQCVLTRASAIGSFCSLWEKKIIVHPANQRLIKMISKSATIFLVAAVLVQATCGLPAPQVSVCCLCAFVFPSLVTWEEFNAGKKTYALWFKFMDWSANIIMRIR